MTTSIVHLAQRTGHRIEADPSRVIIQLFVPGQEGFEHHESRATQVLWRLMALSEEDVDRSLADIMRRFDDRHRDIEGTFERHADVLSDRLGPDEELSRNRRLLLGATFTSEYSIEGAALCNPSMVAHPDQSGVAPGDVRVVMSVRGIGEGHRSSIGFRTAQVSSDGTVLFDPAPQFAIAGEPTPAVLDAAVFHGELHRLRSEGENADFVFEPLGDQFDAIDLEAQLLRLEGQLSTRQHGGKIAALIRRVAERTYGVRFPANSIISERVLRPMMEAERVGMEDARFVRFVDDDGSVSYLATYTAYNGEDISQQLLRTSDFASFTSSPMVGPAAANKGLAIFPRKIGGNFVALSRSDRETNTITTSDNPLHWEESSACQVPTRSWEILQLGNCGSPIETEAGWLVLTHGVGPMRTYSIGALLLDLDDPTRIIGDLDEPLLSPALEEQNGYVPNVVYSCGAFLHGQTLVLPYGIADAAIGVATVSLADLLTQLVR